MITTLTICGTHLSANKQKKKKKNIKNRKNDKTKTKSSE